jgi:hypothetical protein
MIRLFASQIKHDGFCNRGRTRHVSLVKYSADTYSIQVTEHARTISLKHIGGLPHEYCCIATWRVCADEFVGTATGLNPLCVPGAEPLSATNPAL